MQKWHPELMDVHSALQVLQRQSDAAVPFRANGQCRMGLVADDGKTQRFSLPVSLYVNPPYQMYMQGQAGIGPAGLVYLGCNDREYWLGIRPELNTFWWGLWSDMPEGRLPISPGVILESLGLFSPANTAGRPDQWVYSRQTSAAVLTWLDPDGRPRKRIFLYPATGMIRRIEYLDWRGRVAVEVDLGRYERLTESFLVPSRISLVSYEGGNRRCWVRLALSSIMHRRYSEQFRSRYYQRPEPYGFDRVIRIEAGDLQ